MPGANRRGFRFTPTRLIVGSFAVAALLGTLLLLLPAATRAGGLRPVDALFTAVSALCVTGLAVVNTGTTFTHFGQLVILGLIQIGGLGVMTVSSLLALMIGQRLSLRSALAVQEGLNLPEFASPGRLLRAIVLFVLVAEGLGALLLYFSFVRAHAPVSAAYQAIFHSISAFCNAGFGLYPDNLEPFVADWLVNWTVTGLIILGGIGFFTVHDVRRYLDPRQVRRRLSLHSKMVLTATLILITGGAALIYLLEYAGTLRGLDAGTKYLAAYFQSVTCRTAGFNTLPIGAMGAATLLVMIVLMFIGGSPGGTAGGVKTTSASVLLLLLYALVRERAQVQVFGRRLPRDLVSRTVALATASMALVLGVTFVMLLTESAIVETTRGYFLNIMFEVVSAFGTVGLSTGITPLLSDTGKLLISLTMFIGRVGPLTLALAVFGRGATPEVGYPEEQVMIG